MQVGVVTEIKPSERRVALTPAGAAELVGAGHDVLVQAGAGVGSGFGDEAYTAAGAKLAPNAADVWGDVDLMLKVKEPIASEYGLLSEDTALFTYLHLAAAPALTDALVAAKTTGIAYETVTETDGSLPLLAPMSEIAGRLAGQAGAYFLQHPLGGRGVLIGGAPGVAPARVVVIGGGVVGFNAARVAAGMGAEVTILERNPRRLRELEDRFDGRIRVLMSDPLSLEEEVTNADVVIGAVLIAGAAAPKLITQELLGKMRSRSVIVDVAIDQGGCAVTSRATTHDEPTYVVDDVLHYCVANMPGAVPATSTRALTNATMPYIRILADRGVEAALESDPRLAAGLNTKAGEITLAELLTPVAA
ncbi:alanine dehydrogenase [Conexibacter woesei]|uniref:Alanine dehydrogenase n=1 Tax=Conexibacter woesei (strain DSM 14684 / CCUG 47730 / CIP 108061 / JCM 11494 / NBRC 100937 / ID131577) TaxID=469383 RepID=D3EZD5_CONWI|nr:alanine dehydrogenase [Conexibacter woesei]ADB51900.1 alanine dehydrogenase [Conexibacter woesei DSM 14684]